MPTSTRSAEFYNLARAFYESLGDETEWGDVPSALRVTPRQSLYRAEDSARTGALEGYLIFLQTAGSIEPQSHHDLILIDDSPLAPAPRRIQGGTRFGRRLLFPGWHDFVRQELADPVPEAIDNVEEVGESSSRAAHRVLLCADRDDAVQIMLQRRRRRLLKELNRDDDSTPMELPVALDPFQVRERGLIPALRDRLQIATRTPLADEVYLGALRCGYLHLFVDWISDWNLNGDIDPNQGTVAEVLHAVGEAGRFALGCDQIFVFHFVCRDLLEDKRLPDGKDNPYQYRTLGERFTQDRNLRCEILGLSSESLSAEDPKRHQDRAHRRTQGLLGSDDWRGLLRDLAVLTCSQERPDYLSDHIVRQAIRERLPENRRLATYTNLVTRTLYGTGLFQYDPQQGTRFRTWNRSETLFAEALHLAFEDLREYGHNGEDGRTLLRVVDLLSSPQLNERQLYRALVKYGSARGGAEGCKELVLDYLASALDREYNDVRDDQQLRRFRLGVLLVVVVLNAWLRKERREGKKSLEGIESLKGIRLDLSRIDATQLYVRDLDLRQANLSNATISFAYFVDCDLQDADLRTAYMPSVKLIGGSQKDARFERADLTAAILSDGDYSGAKFHGASLWAADLSKGKKLLSKQLRVAEKNITKTPGAGDKPQERLDLSMLEACLHTLYARSREDASIRGTSSAEPLYHCRLAGLAFRLKPQADHSTDLSVLFLSKRGGKPREEPIARVTSFDFLPDGPDGVLLAYTTKPGKLYAQRLRISDQTLADPRPVERTAGWFDENQMPVLRFLGRSRRIALASTAGVWLADLDLQNHGEPLQLPREGRRSLKVECMLEVEESGAPLLLAGWSDGRITVFDLETRKLLSTAARGTARPVAMGYIESHNQVIVARADNSVDVLHLAARLLRLGTFQLAHESIHSILSYPGQSRYLIAGAAARVEGEQTQKPLFAICNANLEVLAVWPFLGKEGVPMEFADFEDLLERSLEFDIPSGLSQTEAGRELVALEHRDIDRLTEWLADGKLALQRQHGSTTDEGDKPGLLPADQRGELTLELSNDQPFPRLSTRRKLRMLDLLSVRVGQRIYHLRTSLQMLRYSPDGKVEELRRQVRQDTVQVEGPCRVTSGKASGNPVLVLRFRHPVLQKPSTLMLPHGVEATLSYDAEAVGETAKTADLAQKFTPERPNPFRGYNMPVQGTEFYAHRKIVEQLTKKAMAGDAFVVKGARRSGKSSVLLEAQRNLEANENVFVMRFDLKESDRDSINLARRIVQHIPGSLRRKHKTGFDAGKLLRLDLDDPQELLEQAAQQLESLMALYISHDEERHRKPIIVVMLDEWGHLFGVSEGFHIQAKVLNSLNDFYNDLRMSLPELKSHYRFVFAGLPWHFKEFSATSSSGLQSYITQWFTIPFVDDVVIRDMIYDKLSKESLVAEDATMKECLRMASGQMHDANLLMYFSIENLFSGNRKSESKIRKADLRQAERKLVDHYRQYRKALWEGLDEEGKEWVLSEIIKERPCWDNPSVAKTNCPAALEPFFRMAYSKLDEDLDDEVLFLPHGLKESIIRFTKASAADTA